MVERCFFICFIYWVTSHMYELVTTVLDQQYTWKYIVYQQIKFYCWLLSWVNKMYWKFYRVLMESLWICLSACHTHPEPWTVRHSCKASRNGRQMALLSRPRLRYCPSLSERRSITGANWERPLHPLGQYCVMEESFSGAIYLIPDGSERDQCLELMYAWSLYEYLTGPTPVAL